jgi:hypothetical protein
MSNCREINAQPETLIKFWRKNNFSVDRKVFSLGRSLTNIVVCNTFEQASFKSADHVLMMIFLEICR